MFQMQMGTDGNGNEVAEM